MNTVTGSGQVSWIHVLSLPTIPPPNTRCCPVVMFAWPNGRSQSARVGLRQSVAGSPQRQAESSSSSCGLVVRLRLLFTLPRGNAITFDYGSEHRSGRNLHPPVSIHSPSHYRRQVGGYVVCVATRHRHDAMHLHHLRPAGRLLSLVQTPSCG